MSGAERQPSAGLQSRPPESPDEELDRMRPTAEVSEQAGLSAVRIRALINEGKVAGELRREGRGPGKWYTTTRSVMDYRESLWTPQEWGRKGGLIAGRGRPKPRD